MAKTKKSEEKARGAGQTLEIDVDSFVRTRDSVSLHFLLFNLIFLVLDLPSPRNFISSSVRDRRQPRPHIIDVPCIATTHAPMISNTSNPAFLYLCDPIDAQSNVAISKVDFSSTTTRHCLHPSRPAPPPSQQSSTAYLFTSTNKY
jgi:hypothetical protein